MLRVAVPASLSPLSRARGGGLLVGAGSPCGTAAIRAHAEQVADVIIRGITA